MTIMKEGGVLERLTYRLYHRGKLPGCDHHLNGGDDRKRRIKTAASRIQVREFEKTVTQWHALLRRGLELCGGLQSSTLGGRMPAGRRLTRNGCGHVFGGGMLSRDRLGRGMFCRGVLRRHMLRSSGPNRRECWIRIRNWKRYFGKLPATSA